MVLIWICRLLCQLRKWWFYIKNNIKFTGKIYIKIKRFWDIIVFAFFIIELSLVGLFFIPSIFGIKAYIVTSGSMEPELPVGSLIYVKSTDKEILEIGDSITFYINVVNLRLFPLFFNTFFIYYLLSFLHISS